jgi:hypothetical protein
VSVFCYFQTIEKNAAEAVCATSTSCTRFSTANFKPKGTLEAPRTARFYFIHAFLVGYGQIERIQAKKAFVMQRKSNPMVLKVDSGSASAMTTAGKSILGEDQKKISARSLAFLADLKRRNIYDSYASPGRAACPNYTARQLAQTL